VSLTVAHYYWSRCKLRMCGKLRLILMSQFARGATKIISEAIVLIGTVFDITAFIRITFILLQMYQDSLGENVCYLTQMRTSVFPSGTCTSQVQLTSWTFPWWHCRKINGKVPNGVFDFVSCVVVNTVLIIVLIKCILISAIYLINKELIIL